MSEQDATQEQAPRRGGVKYLGLVIVILAVAAAFYYLPSPDMGGDADKAGIETSDKAQRDEADLPMFAPKPDPAGDAEAEAPEVVEPPSQTKPEATPTVTMQAAAPRTDKVLTLAFIEDLAQYLAAGYQPGGTKDNSASSGVTTVTFKKLNMRYGVELYGMEVDRAEPAMGRKQALDHLMSPITLRLAYSLFAEDFIHALAGAGEGQSRAFAVQGGFSPKAVSAGHVQEMLDIYATLIRDIGRTYETFASRPDLVNLMERYFKAAQAVNDAYGRYADREAQDAPDKELDAISLDIKKAITEREGLRRELMRGAAPGKGSLLSEGDVMDIAAWVYRRLAADPDSINAVGALASLSQEMADSMRRFNPAAQ